MMKGRHGLIVGFKDFKYFLANINMLYVNEIIMLLFKRSHKCNPYNKKLINSEMLQEKP